MLEQVRSNMELSGITFIYSNVDFADVDLPFVISETMSLRAATETEILQLNDHLGDTYGSLSRAVVPFDHELVEIEENGRYKTIYKESDKSRWWVIAFNGSNNQIIELEKISTLINPKLYYGSTFLYSKSNQQGKPNGILYSMSSKIELLINESRKKHVNVRIEELKKLKNYYKHLIDNRNKFEHVNYVLELYFDSSGLGIHSSLMTLILFSIIESLVAHKPRRAETLDSITHQIKNKLNLLSKRFDLTVKHQEHFGEINYPNLWSKLYRLRSDIAHGQRYNFVGENSCLKSVENSNIFLDKVTRELIKLAILEPELIADLREC